MPCADEVWQLHHGKTPEAKLFQQFCEDGHYAGRTKPTSTRQGIYAVTPSGKLLASWNSRRVDYVAKQLTAALEAWDALEDAERYPENALTAGPRAEDHYPEDGLVLEVFSRDLPRGSGEQTDDWRKDAWNLDHLWLSSDEARALADGTLPAGAARRLVRLHGRDNVRGQSPHFKDKAVTVARLASTARLQDGGVKSLTLTGAGAATQAGKWSVDDRHDAPADQVRAFSGNMYGHAVWNGGRFTEFELAWVGDRTGATKYNGRADDAGPAPMAVVFRLAPDGDRVAPSRFYDYGWR